MEATPIGRLRVKHTFLELDQDEPSRAGGRNSGARRKSDSVLGLTSGLFAAAPGGEQVHFAGLPVSGSCARANLLDQAAAEGGPTLGDDPAGLSDKASSSPLHSSQSPTSRALCSRGSWDSVPESSKRGSSDTVQFSSKRGSLDSVQEASKRASVMSIMTESDFDPLDAHVESAGPLGGAGRQRRSSQRAGGLQGAPMVWPQPVRAGAEPGRRPSQPRHPGAAAAAAPEDPLGYPPATYPSYVSEGRWFQDASYVAARSYDAGTRVPRGGGPLPPGASPPGALRHEGVPLPAPPSPLQAAYGPPPPWGGAALEPPLPSTWPYYAPPSLGMMPWPPPPPPPQLYGWTVPPSGAYPGAGRQAVQARPAPGPPPQAPQWAEPERGHGWPQFDPLRHGVGHRQSRGSARRPSAGLDAEELGFGAARPTLGAAATASSTQVPERRAPTVSSAPAELPRQQIHPDQRTTVMMRNMPEQYVRDDLTAVLDGRGFRGLYDFVYMPMNFRKKASFGYAFVNLVSPEAAKRLHDEFQGFATWGVQTEKVCEVSWSDMHQGLDAHIERYRNSPVMHESVPDQYKPVMYSSEGRIAFPPPTKKIRQPRVRRSAEGDGADDDDNDLEDGGPPAPPSPMRLPMSAGAADALGVLPPVVAAEVRAR